MIYARIIEGEPTLVPPELLAALGLKAGDEIAFERAGNVFIVRHGENDGFTNNFSTFTEWSSEAASVWDDL